MSMSKKRNAFLELLRIEDAMVESILEISGKELRKDIVEAGDDPDGIVAAVDKAIGEGRSKFAKTRIQNARDELSLWRKNSRNIATSDRENALLKLDQLRGGDQALNSKMMLAARKGEGLSESDLQGLLEDLAELERLEREDGGE